MNGGRFNELRSLNMLNSVQAVMSIPIGQGRNISLTSPIMNYGHLCPLVHSIHVPVDTAYGWSNTHADASIQWNLSMAMVVTA